MMSDLQGERGVVGKSCRVGVKDVDACLASYGAPIRSLALRLLKLVQDVEPTALEQIDGPAKLLAYGFSATYGGTICSEGSRSLKAPGAPRAARQSSRDPGRGLAGFASSAEGGGESHAAVIDIPR